MAQAARVMTDDVATMPMYYNPVVMGHTAALKGPTLGGGDASDASNVHEWCFVR
jgi:hypothetical protein